MSLSKLRKIGNSNKIRLESQKKATTLEVLKILKERCDAEDDSVKNVIIFNLSPPLLSHRFNRAHDNKPKWLSEINGYQSRERERGSSLQFSNSESKVLRLCIWFRQFLYFYFNFEIPNLCLQQSWNQNRCRKFQMVKPFAQSYWWRRLHKKSPLNVPSYNPTEQVTKPRTNI